ncbi:hypothetical protein MesoLjLc_36800 [Mesorhizobium sp. L-8-10]|uniref:HupE/UreJ family protein n=1 Tax=Mesorhizobium sp. L-8-10 TaxID=2744523 RepID=UPI0019293A2C|nr:HupE/UreJ family protein [Mesorhizobium sp. L-8-10]BCH31750.1 hypothetical protein MesoLjLc_36800 [Mesorhizobium sp. L-8-10]
MKRSAAAWLCAIAILSATTPVRAHAPLDGVGDFYAGLLHPIIVPTELLAIAAIGLLLGFCGFKHCHYGIPALCGGLILGLAMGFIDVAEGAGSGLLVGIALVAAATVTAGIGLPVAVAAVLALVGGFAVGLDAQPETQSFPMAFLTGTATVLSGTVVGLVVAAVVLSRDKFWQEVAVRVAGSWLTASGMLYFSWRLVGPSG